MSDVDVKIQSNNLLLDPVFHLDDGKTLEVFTCYGIDAWTLQTPGEPLILAPWIGIVVPRHDLTGIVLGVTVLETRVACRG